MTYYIFIEDDKTNGAGQCEISSPDVEIINFEVSEELYNSFNEDPDRYMWNGSEIVENPDYEQQQANKRRKQFNKDFFNTSLGYIRRKVSMKTGETKDFLTDLLPVISMAVNSGQSVTIITYAEPDFTHDITDLESLQEIKAETTKFIMECFNQVSTDFTGV